MYLWIDNTAIHSSGKCLEKRANGENDIAGILQLATQLVFSEKVFLGNYPMSEVGEKTISLVERITSYGIPEDTFQFVDMEKHAFFEACKNAAERLAEDLIYEFSNEDIVDKNQAKSAMPNLAQTQIELEEKTHKYLVEGLSDEERNDISGAMIQLGEDGASIYMLVASDSLWKTIRNLISNGGWTDKHTSRLLVFTRYYINEQLSLLSREKCAGVLEYAPSVTRSRMVSNRGQYVMNTLSRVVGDAAKALEPVLMGVPSISNALAICSKSCPEGILEEASKARSKAAPLRKYLNALIEKDYKKAETDKRNELHVIRKGINDLAQPLYQSLGLQKVSSIGDALELNFVGPFPVPSPKFIINWFKYIYNKRRIVVLSEFAKTLANQRVDPHYYKKLLKNSCISSL